MLSHYWTADDPPELRRAQAEDWIGDLIEFDPGIVARACAEWRRAQSKRPTIADIRKLCIEDCEIRRPPPEYVALDDPNWRDSYARSVGWSSWLERQDAIDAQQERYRKGEEWRRSPEAQLDPAVRGFKTTARATASAAAAALGVKAKEIAPTADEIAAELRQLGIEPPAADGAAA